MVTGYSRWLSALLIPTRTAADLFAGWWQLISGLGAVPRVLVWDGEGAIGRWRAGRAELTADCQAFCGTLGSKVVVCKPADPEAKGIIERAHDYLERSFLPGRSFTGPDDFNSQLQQWLTLVNARRRRALGCEPTDRITADRQAMLALPPVAPATGCDSGSTTRPRTPLVAEADVDFVVPAGAGATFVRSADVSPPGTASSAWLPESAVSVPGFGAGPIVEAPPSERMRKKAPARTPVGNGRSAVLARISRLIQLRPRSTLRMRAKSAWWLSQTTPT